MDLGAHGHLATPFHALDPSLKWYRFVRIHLKFKLKWKEMKIKILPLLMSYYRVRLSIVSNTCAIPKQLNIGAWASHLGPYLTWPHSRFSSTHIEIMGDQTSSSANHTILYIQYTQSWPYVLWYIIINVTGVPIWLTVCEQRGIFPFI